MTDKHLKWENIWGKVLTVVLVLLVLGGVAALAYSVAVPFKEPFTEFYLLGTSGKAEGYPGELKVGEEGRVLVGIVNHEYEESIYILNVRVDGDTNIEETEVILEHGERWEEEVAFSFSAPGDGRKVEFLLSGGDNNSTAQELYLLVDVIMED